MPTLTPPTAPKSPVDSGVGLSLPSGAGDMLRYLSQYSLGQVGTNRNQFNDIASQFANRPGPSLPDVNQLLPGMVPTIQGFFDRTNEGLTPQAMSALRQESTAGLQDRYEGAASNLRTQLLQRGLYGGQLPASSGELLRQFGPLQSDLANAQSKAGRDAVLADQAQMMQNRQLAGQAVGMGTNLFSALGQQSIAGYNAQTGNLEDMFKAAATGAQLDQGALDSAIKAAATRAELEPTSFRNILLSSLMGAGAKALTDPKTFNSVVKGIGGLAGKVGGALGIGGGTGAANAMGATLATSQGLLGAGAAAPLGATGALAAPEVGAGVFAPGAATATTTGTGGGALSSIAGFMTNPITIGVGAAIAGAIMWKRSQVHPTANTFVQKFQNPFGDHLNSIVSSFYDAIGKGMTKDQAGKAVTQVKSLISDFEKDRTTFSAKGSHEKTVASQAKSTMDSNFGPNYTHLLEDMELAAKEYAA